MFQAFEANPLADRDRVLRLRVFNGVEFFVFPRRYGKRICMKHGRRGPKFEDVEALKKSKKIFLGSRPTQDELDRERPLPSLSGGI